MEFINTNCGSTVIATWQSMNPNFQLEKFTRTKRLGSISRPLIHSRRRASNRSERPCPQVVLINAFYSRAPFRKRGDNSKVPKAILRSPKDDLILVFYSNQTAVQCYSANYFNGLGSRKELHRRSTSTENSGGYKKQEAIYLEFQEPSSLCTNLTLQKNLKSYLNSDDHGQHQQSEEKSQTTTVTNTILYPNQVYSNWFFIDIFI
ncbi:hypothetical protein Pst134EB_007902 [Puccinia striiformis f. sp. tritici]|nr:hypothetical protein Pst134EB_007902 [Puccinia striiformis f. sp. tritici]